MTIESDYEPEDGEPPLAIPKTPVELVVYLDELNDRGVPYHVHVRRASGVELSGPAYPVSPRFPAEERALPVAAGETQLYRVLFAEIEHIRIETLE